MRPPKHHFFIPLHRRSSSRPSPWPSRITTCGEFEALSCTTNFAWRAPLADGLNWIAIAHSLPTASVDPQVVSRESIEKSVLP